MTKACVADVRSAGGLSNSCSLEGRDGEGGKGGKRPWPAAERRCRSQEPPPFEVGVRAKRLLEEPPDARDESGSELYQNRVRGNVCEADVTSACGILCRVRSVTCMM